MKKGAQGCGLDIGGENIEIIEVLLSVTLAILVHFGHWPPISCLTDSYEIAETMA